MGHYSGDVAVGLQQITAAVETLQTNMIVSGGATEGADSEVSSRSSVSATETPVMSQSSSHLAGIGSGRSGHAGRKGRK